jgi:TRAP-type C4-dicarboxylate transport system substrate-binding protein
MTPVVMPPPEMYSALERKVTDGEWLGKMTPLAFGTYKLEKYMIDHSYFMDNHTWIINPDKWNSLPKHLQDALFEAIKWGEKSGVAYDLYQVEWEKIRKAYLDAGMEFIKFSPADAKRYVQTAYEAEWEYLKKTYPDVGPKLADMMYEPYKDEFFKKL